MENYWKLRCTCVFLINMLSHYGFGRKLLIIFGLIISVFLLFIPLVFIFVSAISSGWTIVWNNLVDTDILHAVYLTFLIVFISIPINIVFGILISWLITRFNFMGKRLLLILIDIPFSVSPVIVGFLHLLLYGSNGCFGSYLESFDLHFIFSWPSMVMVTIFVTCPFIAHELIPTMFSYGIQEEEAALLLGASGWQMFCHIIFPNIRWSLLYGIVLTNARAIGEFGAVSIVSGLIRGETYTLSLQVELLYQDYNFVGAFTVASLLSLISIFMIVLKKIIQFRCIDH